MTVEALKRLLMLPEARDLDLESEEAAATHAELLRSKGFLRQLYLGYYRDLAEAAGVAPEGPVVEVGSGTGFLQEVLPRALRVDIRPGALVDVRASAEELPMGTDSVAAVVGLNVMHHMPTPLRFLEECSRVLKPGGRLALVEPFASPLSRLIYGHLHHEEFRPDREGWDQTATGPMSGADGAIPWVMLVRDRAALEQALPTLRLEYLRPHTIGLYMLSGGLSFRSFAPPGLYPVLAGVEGRVPERWRTLLSSMMTVVLRAD